MRGVTHAGPFQADELLAWLVFRFLFPAMRLARTFDRETIDAADFVWDLGGIFDHLRGRYDHHQKDGEELRLRANGVPRAALGLVWMFYGVEYCKPFAAKFGVSPDELARLVDRSVIEGLDAVDCGKQMGELHLAGNAQAQLRAYGLPQLVEALNPQPPIESTEDVDYDRAFFAAADIVQPLFDALVNAEAAKLCGARIVEERRTDSPILVLPMNCNFRDEVSERHPHVLFVVYPLSPIRWVLQAVGIAAGSQQLRRSLPRAWSGLQGIRLQEASGVLDAIAVSNTLFRGTAASEEGAIRLAEIALQFA